MPWYLQKACVIHSDCKIPIKYSMPSICTNYIDKKPTTTRGLQGSSTTHCCVLFDSLYWLRIAYVAKLYMGHMPSLENGSSQYRLKLSPLHFTV